MCFLIATLGACSFAPGALERFEDASVEDAPDAVVPTWVVDSLSGKGAPATTSEWSDLIAAYALTEGGSPTNLWLFQDASGMITDAIGAAPLSPVNLPSYRNNVPGWSRVGAGTQDIDADQGFLTTLTGNLNGPAYMLLAYVAVATAPTKERSLVGIGAATDHRCVSVTPASVLKGTGAGVTPTLGVASTTMSVHPIVVKLDPAPPTYIVYSDQEKLAVPWRATTGTGGLVMIGNALIGAANARYLYAALWSGEAATLTDSGVKTLLQGLGWTVTGY